jgi:hypothetical protein
MKMDGWMDGCMRRMELGGEREVKAQDGESVLMLSLCGSCRVELGSDGVGSVGN